MQFPNCSHWSVYALTHFILFYNDEREHMRKRDQNYKTNTLKCDF